MAERLVDELKRRVELAKQAEAGRTLDRERAAAESQEQRFRETMSCLPELLREAADRGNRSFEVMRLSERGGDLETLSRSRSVFPEHMRISVSNLRGVARRVHDYLVGEGLSVEIQERHEVDEGQGRAWTDYILVVKF